jgi:hypothetical protein
MIGNQLKAMLNGQRQLRIHNQRLQLVDAGGKEA